jgi:predicted phage terminase large subunit-like protein
MNWTEIINNQRLRIEAGRLSLLTFGILYFPHYITFKTAEFQKKYITRLQDDTNMRVAECDFRESGKSVWTTLIFPIWCIVYKKRNFIIIGSETKTLSGVHLSSIINTLEANEYIIQDFGKLYRQTDKDAEITRKKTVTDFMTENNIRVMAKGRGESVRGLRHLQYRPELFIGDDMDSNNSVLNMEQRNKLYNWIKAEVLSGMNQEYGKAVVIGNMIHFDCIMARLKKDDQFDYHEVPIHKDEKLAWPERYFWTKAEADNYNFNITNKRDRKTSIEKIKEDKGSLVFAQEYLLQPMSDSQRLIKPEWIKTYSELPKDEWLIMKGAIDPAIKEKETSDFSAITIGGRDKRDGKIYITDSWKDRCSMDKQAEMVRAKHNQWQTVEFAIEVNAYQEALKQTIDKHKGSYVPTKGVTQIRDKVTRLLAIQPLIERGEILFNENLKELIESLIQFPLAPHDDDVDSFITLVERLIKIDDFGYITSNKSDDNIQNLDTANLMQKTF